jgi:hypothetical protein
VAARASRAGGCFGKWWEGSQWWRNFKIQNPKFREISRFKVQAEACDKESTSNSQRSFKWQAPSSVSCWTDQIEDEDEDEDEDDEGGKWLGVWGEAFMVRG